MEGTDISQCSRQSLLHFGVKPGSSARPLCQTNAAAAADSVAVIAAGCGAAASQPQAVC